MKNTLFEYFNFTRSERKGIVFLLFVIIFFLSLPQITALFIHTGKDNFALFQQQIQEWETGIITMDSLRKEKYTTRKKQGYKKKYNKQKSNHSSTTPLDIVLSPFIFDPNTISKSELINLGLPKKTVNTFVNFRNKGGKFYKKEDIKKIYGFQVSWYNELVPYMHIKKTRSTAPDIPKPAPYKKDNHSVASTNKFPTPKHNQHKKHEQYNKRMTPNTIQPIDINNATAESFETLYGIGPYYAKKIINFRTALGGFISTEQLSEVYGLPDSTFQNIKPHLKITSTLSSKININTATVDELKKHPYIKWSLAKAIVKYRENHGNYNSLEDLKKNYAIPKNLYSKITPYLTI